ncbi:MAG: ferrous iron transport protein A [Clostridia bacterium]|nr:ferrous iron transport protein A [Clostridia bacterium]
MSKPIAMNNIEINATATVRKINAPEGIRRRLMDIGLTENSKIECIGKSPMGDPSAYLICGAVIAIRASDCADILVEV